jgi:hypothetical protein
MKNVAIGFSIITILFFSTNVFAKKNSQANPLSRVRAFTSASVESILIHKKVDKPKNGYHVGDDIRYQLDSNNPTYTRHSGGKNSSGRYNFSEVR